ncbi:MAG: cupin domain-containing protein [Steroidobacteraceae bacterium]
MTDNLKMPGKFTGPVHFHTSDEWGVIIAGVFVNGKPGSQDILLPAGS